MFVTLRFKLLASLYRTVCQTACCLLLTAVLVALSSEKSLHRHTYTLHAGFASTNILPQAQVASFAYL